MKKIILFLLLAVCGWGGAEAQMSLDSVQTDMFGQETAQWNQSGVPDIRYVLRGRPEGRDAVMAIANATNGTTFPVIFVSDYSTGDKYVLELQSDGRFMYGRNFHISDQLITNINRHRANPYTAESINQICMTQATAMQDVFREGSRLQQQLLQELAKQANSTESCNCPNDPDLQKNADLYEDQRIGDLDDGRYILMNEWNAQQIPNFQNLKEEGKIKKTWFGRNWFWVVPAGLVLGYIAVDGISDGEWLDFNFTKSTTKIIYYDPNDPNGPNYNPNAMWRGIFNPPKPVKNMAQESYWQQTYNDGSGIKFAIFN